MNNVKQQSRVCVQESPIAVAALRLSFRRMDSWGSRPRLHATTAPRLGLRGRKARGAKDHPASRHLLHAGEVVKRCVETNAQRESVYARLQF